jgi:hypothetical protein
MIVSFAMHVLPMRYWSDQSWDNVVINMHRIATKSRVRRLRGEDGHAN